jgi:hypothetical protein
MFEITPAVAKLSEAVNISDAQCSVKYEENKSIGQLAIQLKRKSFILTIRLFNQNNILYIYDQELKPIMRASPLEKSDIFHLIEVFQLRIPLTFIRDWSTIERFYNNEQYATRFTASM